MYLYNQFVLKEQNNYFGKLLTNNNKGIRLGQTLHVPQVQGNDGHINHRLCLNHKSFRKRDEANFF